jgi:hypothetical protein
MKARIALAVVAASSLMGAKAFAAAPAQQQGPSSGFNGPARVGGLEVNLGGGTMRRVPCAPGSQPGASCFLSR